MQDAGNVHRDMTEDGSQGIIRQQVTEGHDAIADGRPKNTALPTVFREAQVVAGSDEVSTHTLRDWCEIW